MKNSLITTIIAAALVALIAGAVVIGKSQASNKGLSADQVAAQYTKTVGNNNGLLILGDKIWSHHKTKYGTVIGIRVRFCPTVGALFGQPTSTLPPAARVCAQRASITTFFVHIIKSQYQVAN